MHTTNEILQEAHNFYTKLYSSEHISEDDIYAYLEQFTLTSIIDENDNKTLCADVSEKECFEALTSMGKNKSPGPDGLPVEFYISFWNELKTVLVAGYQESYNDEELSVMQKMSIMPLIFKKNQRELFKNYRPLTLSNVNYKIIAFVLARRLQKIIAKLISKEQSAYIKGRYIGENIRLLLDVMEYCDKTNESGILLFLDFQKAFDSLEWKFIELVLEVWFSVNIQKMV